VQSQHSGVRVPLRRLRSAPDSVQHGAIGFTEEYNDAFEDLLLSWKDTKLLNEFRWQGIKQLNEFRSENRDKTWQDLQVEWRSLKDEQLCYRDAYDMGKYKSLTPTDMKNRPVGQQR
jgi:hypothetical protein